MKTKRKHLKNISLVKNDEGYWLRFRTKFTRAEATVNINKLLTNKKCSIVDDVILTWLEEQLERK